MSRVCSSEIGVRKLSATAAQGLSELVEELAWGM
jgi:hypothetical protein